MIPIALQIALIRSTDIAFSCGSALGSVFGDHSSPISDTTVVASLASGSDHIEHVRTQLPYALICAVLATVGFSAELARTLKMSSFNRQLRI